MSELAPASLLSDGPVVPERCWTVDTRVNPGSDPDELCPWAEEKSEASLYCDPRSRAVWPDGSSMAQLEWLCFHGFFEPQYRVFLQWEEKARPRAALAWIKLKRASMDRLLADIRTHKRLLAADHKEFLHYQLRALPPTGRSFPGGADYHAAMQRLYADSQ